ncbi:hypothetical protein [Aquimarina algicola]|nr:hypothetical protein [Aquimarina algicola]
MKYIAYYGRKFLDKIHCRFAILVTNQNVSFGKSYDKLRIAIKP